MEELNGTLGAGGEPRSRAQLLLVAAIAMAVIFLALGVITNAAIFTQNLASRGDTAGSGEALAVRGEVQSNVADVVERYTVDVEDSNSQDIVNDYVNNYGQSFGFLATSETAIVRVTTSTSAITTGTRLLEPPSSPLEKPGGSGDWNLIVRTERVRSFNVTVSSGSVGSDNIEETRPIDFDNNFIINLTGNGSFVTPRKASWQIHVGESDSNPGERKVQVLKKHKDPGAGDPEWFFEGECLFTGAPVTINVTSATINGEYCAALAKIWKDGQRPGGSGYFEGNTFSIKYMNVGSVDGGYQLVASGNKPPSLFWDESDAGAPAVNSYAIYSAEVTFRYNGTSMGYKDRIRIAPGEPDDD